MSKVNITNQEEERYVELQNMALDFARTGYTDELEKMIKHKMSVNLKTLKDDSLIMLASYNGNIETVKMLINHKADINAVNQRGQTPLEGVCFKGNLQIAQLLINSGAKINSKSLMYASIFGNKDVFDYLQSIKKKKKSNIFFSLLVLATTLVRKIVKKYK